MNKRYFVTLFSLRISVAITTFVGIANGRAQPIPALDPNFHPVITHIGGSGSAVAIQPDGKLILAGAFNAISGIARNGLARLNLDGSVDLTFDAGGGACCSTASGQTQVTGAISAVALQPDGKLLIGGSFESVNGTPRRGLARLNANGTLDTTFDPGVGLDPGDNSLRSGAVSAIVVQPDGKVLIGGSFITVGGVNRVGIARLQASGAVDTTFDPGPGVTDLEGNPRHVAAVALLNSGQIIIGGDFRIVNDVGRYGLARLTASGAVDLDFFPEILQLDTTLPQPSIDALVVQPDGKIVFSGSFQWVVSDGRFGLARINADAALDSTFNPSINPDNPARFRVLGAEASGKVIAYHEPTDAGVNLQRVIARLNNDGSIDSTLSLALQPGLGNALQVRGAALQSDGQWLVVGDFAVETDATPRGIARINLSGGLDTAFTARLELSEDLASHVLAVAVQPDGRVLIGGTFNRINGTERGKLARLNRDGTLDTAFAPAVESTEPQSSVSAISIQEDGKILIGGRFTTVNGTARNGVARLNPDGSLDESFDVGTGTSDSNGTTGRVLGIAVQADGKVNLVGDFSIFNGQGIPWAVRLNTNGSVDVPLVGGLDCLNCDTSELSSVAVLTNGFIMISGVFTRISGSAYNGLVRLGADGSLDLGWFSPVASTEQPDALAVASDDSTVVAVTSSDPVSGNNRARLLRLKPDGTQDTDFNPGEILGDSSSAPPVSAIKIDAEDGMIIGGIFTNVAGTVRRGLARLNSDGTLDASFDAGAGFANGTIAPSGGPGSRVTGIELQDDGGIIVGGNFALANGQVRLGLARFQAGSPNPGGARPVISSPARAANGTFSMLVSGEAGRVYRVEASTDFRSWTTVGNVTGAATPQPFSDASANTFPYRFYRVAQ